MDNTEREAIVQIDKYRLDKECVRLPGDYLKWSTRSADLKRDLDEATAQVKVVQAEMSETVRSNPEDFNIEKVTEAAIAAAVLQSSTVQKAQAKVREIQHELDLSQAVVWALEHKKRSLTLLVELHGAGYFSDVKPSERGSESVKKSRKDRKEDREDGDEG